jgi:hypothetical protein
MHVDNNENPGNAEKPEAEFKKKRIRKRTDLPEIRLKRS